jgi:hypothetical protein
MIQNTKMKIIVWALICLPVVVQANVVELISAQTPVKNQGGISGCSIFSATGLLEYKLRQAGMADGGVNLSEQWLLYVTAAQKGIVGVTSIENITALNKHGYVAEDVWPTAQIPWNDLGLLTIGSFFKCGHLNGTDYLQGCLIGQRDPRLLAATDEELTTRGSGLFDKNFYEIRNEANASKQQVSVNGVRIQSPRQAKQYLDAGEPLLLDVFFFYEAWNHRRASEFGLERDNELWSQGTVSYPDKRSKDYANYSNSTRRTGHSVIVVGYDENRVIERTIKDIQGNSITVRSVGVYYFKNSWGTDSFGRNFSIGDRRYPGYGMISMDYAHEYGTFTGMTLNAPK